MPPGPPTGAFSLEAGTWQPWPGLAADIELLLASLPATTVIAAGAKGSGLPRGERALAAAATARTLGCRSLTASEARTATDALKRGHDVQVLLEEGLPCPVTGRLGAIIAAAGTLARSPTDLSGPELQRLEDQKFSDQEVVDLILTAAVASWTARITLGLGRPALD